MTLFDHMKLHAEIAREKASDDWEPLNGVVRTVFGKEWLILGDGDWKIGERNAH